MAMDIEKVGELLEAWLEQYKTKLNILSEKASESGKRFEEQAANLEKLAHNKMQNIHSDKFDPIAHIDFLTEYNKYLRSRVTSLNDTIEMYHAMFESGELTDFLTDIRDFNIERLIDAQEKIIAKYQKGTKKKSEVSQQNWALAQLYFSEEIPKHKKLLSARKAAAKRAGINVKERRLIEMLPVEK
jgi:hypothetical protein